MKNFLIADDQAIVRSGLTTLIKANFSSCHIDEAENQHEIIQRVKENAYDIVILDISMEGTDFFQMLGWFKIISPQARVLIFTTQSETILGRTCLQLGAWGFIPKKAHPDELVLVIKRVLDGQKYISPNIASSLIDHVNKKNQTNPFQNLSARELEIVLLLNDGKTLVQICDLLHIEYSTVNTHKRKIFEKLMVGNVLSLSRLMRTFNVQGSTVNNSINQFD
jgi:two-component system, NarL family, invasion response regulator UvrY